MQREIKFRAWDKQNKSMEEVELLGDEVLRIKHAEWENREDFELMQYTGLKDKNGVEIYEGDIVRFDNDWYSEVYQHECGEWFAAHFSIWENISNDGKENSWEVIGNKYEDLELLKEGEE